MRLYLRSLAIASTLFTISAVDSAQAQSSSAAQVEPSQLDLLGQYFEDNPGLKTTPHSGWKPYNRAKWFRDRITAGTTPPKPGARWEVWQKQRERSSAQSRSASWFEIGPTNFCGRILDIAFDPAAVSTVYVGSASGGLWKTLDGGDTWSPLTDDLPTLAIGGVCVSPFDSSVILIATGEGTPNFDAVGGVGILKSTDAGATWGVTSLSYPVSSGTGFHFLEANDVTGTFLAGGNDGLWRSTSGGDTWDMVLPAASYFDAKWMPGGGGTVMTVGGSVFGGTLFYRSTDDGASWMTTPSVGLPMASLRGKAKLAVTAAAPGRVYAHVAGEFSTDFPTLGIYMTTTLGDTWSTLNSTDDIGDGQGWYNLTIAVDPDDPTRIIAGGVENWLSTDTGATFTETGDGPFIGSPTATHVDHHVIAYEPGSSSTVWVGTDGGVWKSTDDGATWISRREGIATYQFYDICVAQSDPAATYGGTQDNGTPVRDTGDVWFEDTLSGDGMVCNVDPFDATKVFAEVQFGLQALSTDAGATWVGLHGYTGMGDFVTPTDLGPFGESLYIETSDGIFKTTDDGGTWMNVSPGHSAVWINVSDADPMEVWTVEPLAPPVYTTDGGLTWFGTSSFPFPVGTATKVTAHPTSPGTAFVTFAGYAPPFIVNIAMTTDYGASWVDVSGDLPIQPVNTMVVDPAFPDHWYIGTDVGVWFSVDAGTSWIPEDVGLPSAVVNDLEIRKTARKLVAGTHGRGAWELSLPPVPVGVDLVASGPIHMMFDPPSPNPVVGSATFRFAARTDAVVSLDVFDVSGRRVTNVATMDRGDGIIRRASWRVDDVPSGVYFAVLEAGGESLTRKVVVAR